MFSLCWLFWAVPSSWTESWRMATAHFLTQQPLPRACAALSQVQWSLVRVSSSGSWKVIWIQSKPKVVKFGSVKLLLLLSWLPVFTHHQWLLELREHSQCVCSKSVLGDFLLSLSTLQFILLSFQQIGIVWKLHAMNFHLAPTDKGCGVWLFFAVFVLNLCYLPEPQRTFGLCVHWAKEFCRNQGLRSLDKSTCTEYCHWLCIKNKQRKTTQ